MRSPPRGTSGETRRRSKNRQSSVTACPAGRPAQPAQAHKVCFSRKTLERSGSAFARIPAEGPDAPRRRDSSRTSAGALRSRPQNLPARSDSSELPSSCHVVATSCDHAAMISARSGTRRISWSLTTRAGARRARWQLSGDFDGCWLVLIVFSTFSSVVCPCPSTCSEGPFLSLPGERGR